MGLACLIAVFEFIWKSRKLATDENVRHSKLIAKALSHTNENMFHVPKHETGFSKSIQDPSVIANAASIAFGFVDQNEFLRQTAHQSLMVSWALLKSHSKIGIYINRQRYWYSSPFKV